MLDRLCYEARTTSGRPHREREAAAALLIFSSDSEDLAVDEAQGLQNRLALIPQSQNVQTSSCAKVLYFGLTVSELIVEPGQIPTKALYFIL